MRAWPLVAVLLLLPGCSQPPAADLDSTPAGVEMVTPPLLVLADGTYEFNEPAGGGPTPYDPLEFYDIATQVAVNPCSWGGGAYFNNRPIPTAAGTGHKVRNGTMSVMFDWTDADYAQPTMVLGYQAPGMGNVTDSPRIGRGETLELRIEPGNRTNDRSWLLFACMNRSDEDMGEAGWQPGPFTGSFRVHVEFQADPEPVEPEPEAEPGRRTSRN